MIEGATSAGEKMIPEKEASRKDRRDLASYIAAREGTYVIVQRVVSGIIMASGFLTVCFFGCYAYGEDVWNVGKRWYNDVTPEYVPSEFKRSAPKWGYDTFSQESHHTFQERYET